MDQLTSPSQTPIDAEADRPSDAQDDTDLVLYSLDELFGEQPPWYVEEGWSNPADLSTSEEDDVPLVDVKFASGAQHKSVITLDLACDLSVVDAFHVDVLSMLEHDVKLAMLFRTAGGNAFETPQVAVGPEWNGVCFSLVDADMKSNTSDPPWAGYRVAFEPRDEVTQISLLIYGGQQAGVVRFGPLLAQLEDGVSLDSDGEGEAEDPVEDKAEHEVEDKAEGEAEDKGEADSDHEAS